MNSASPSTPGTVKASDGLARHLVAADYELRARRILPPPILVATTMLVAAGFVFTPVVYRQFEYETIAALGFFANLWRYANSGDFAAGPVSTPLLHTWSFGGWRSSSTSSTRCYCVPRLASTGEWCPYASARSRGPDHGGNASTTDRMLTAPAGPCGGWLAVGLLPG